MGAQVQGFEKAPWRRRMVSWQSGLREAWGRRGGGEVVMMV